MLSVRPKLHRDDQIDTQMNVIQEAFAPAKIDFDLQNVVRIINETWFGGIGPASIVQENSYDIDDFT